jgi:uncharacterized DUF497 family protein
VQFDWDSKKAVKNKRKHGIALEEAATIFSDPLLSLSPIRIIPLTKIATLHLASQDWSGF